MKLPLLNKNECIIPICYAYDLGLFEKYNFDFTPHFHDGIWADHDLYVTGEIPCIRGDYSRYLIFKHLDECDPVITHTFSRDFKIISRNKIDNVNQLKDASCLLSLTTSVEFYLDQFSKSNDLNITKLDERNIEVRYERFLAGETDLVMIPDPYAAKLLAQGFHVVHDIRDTDINIKVYMWDRKYLEENPDTPQQLMDIINEATILFNDLSDEEQYAYLEKYEMVDSKEEFVRKNYELNLPFTDVSKAAAKEWFGE